MDWMKWIEWLFPMISLGILYEDDPGQGGGAGTAQAELEAGLGEHGIKPEEKPAEGGDKGEKGKKKEEKPAEKAPEDPEFELEFGEEGKKEKKKIKLSELHKGYMMNDDYTKKTQDLKSKTESVQDLINWSEAIKKDETATKLVIALTKQGLGNPEKLKKALAIIEGQAEAAAGKAEEVDADIKAIEQQLEGLDPESGEAKVLKNLLAMNKTLKKSLKDTQDKLGAIEKAGKDRDAQVTEEQQKALIKEATDLLNGTLDGLTKEGAEGALTFDSDEGKTLWRTQTIAHLKNNPKEYKDKDDFVKAIQEVGKTVHAALQKVGEAAVAKHLKTKKTATPAGGGGQPGAPEKKPLDASNMQTLQTSLEQALDEQEGSKK